MVIPLSVSYVIEATPPEQSAVWAVVEVSHRREEKVLSAPMSRAIRCQFEGQFALPEAMQAARDLQRAELAIERIMWAWYRHPNRCPVAIVRGEDRP